MQTILLQTKTMSTFVTLCKLTWALIIAVDSLPISSDAVEHHLLPHATAQTIFKSAFCVNRQWSIAAINALSTKISYLSLRQIQTLQDRADSLNLTRQSSLFEKHALERKRRLQNYHGFPSKNPLTFRASNGLILIKTKNEYIGSYQEAEFFITAELIPLDQYKSQRSMQQHSRSIRIGRDVLVEISHDLVTISGYNGQKYLFKFHATEHVKIQYYKIRFYRIHSGSYERNRQYVSMIPHGARDISIPPSFRRIQIYDAHFIDKQDHHPTHNYNVSCDCGRQCVLQ